jgi:dihydroorotase
MVQAGIARPDLDLVVKGGHVLDPGTGLDGRMDVGIRGGRIAAIEADIPESGARSVVSATGGIVTAGLIDLHAHCLPGLTYWGVDADAIGSRSGVTTWVDAGSASAFMLPGVRQHVVEPSQVRILSFLNISTVGLVAPNFELTHPAFWDVEALVTMAAANPDLVRGIKVRMGYPTAGEHGVEPLRKALDAGARTGLPVMTHIAYRPPELAEVVELLGPGDIVTHAFTGLSMKIIDDDHRLRPEVLVARERGVIFDLGHGTGSLAFDTVEAVLEQGFLPDTISTDIHQVSVVGPMFDLPMTMTKMLSLGMTLPDIIRATTETPARVLGYQGELGTLREGAAGDITILEVSDEPLTIYDSHMQSRQAERRIRSRTTIVAGRLLERRPQPRSAPWMEIPAAARAFEDRLHAGADEELADALREPSHFRDAQPRELT